VIKYIGVFLVGYVILRYVYIGSVALYRQLNPPPPPPPTAGFGPLPVVRFPEQEPYDLLFNIQTPTGQFPQFADRFFIFLFKERDFLLWTKQKDWLPDLDLVRSQCS
jgi:hypothetical protein